MTTPAVAAEYVEMRDAADPDALTGWTGPVQGYPNRTPPWIEADFMRWHDHMRTSVRREAHYAAQCREIDVEKGAALAVDVPPFLAYRSHLGFSDGGVYVSLSGWQAVRTQLEKAGIRPNQCRIRIAAWGLAPHRFEPSQLGNGWLAWAHQFAGNVKGAHGAYDRTAVFGSREFSHR